MGHTLRSGLIVSEIIMTSGIVAIPILAMQNTALTPSLLWLSLAFGLNR